MLSEIREGIKGEISFPHQMARYMETEPPAVHATFETGVTEKSVMDWQKRPLSPSVNLVSPFALLTADPHHPEQKHRTEDKEGY